MASLNIILLPDCYKLSIIIEYSWTTYQAIYFLRQILRGDLDTQKEREKNESRSNISLSLFLSLDTYACLVIDILCVWV